MGRLAAAVMAAAVLVLAGAFVSLADEGGDTARFVSGTKVNGVGVGGLTVDEAKARIEGFYAGEYNLTIRERGGRQETIAGTDIGYKVEVPEGLKAILDAQNAAGRVSGPDADNSHTMAMTVTYSQEALGAKIKALTLISGSGITVTSDARISSYEEGQPFSIIPAVQGNNVDEAKTTEVITAAVKAGQNSVDVDSAGCYYQVNIWETDENLMALCSRMNQYRDMSVNYVFGSETETLGGETIATWITGSQDGVPAVDHGLCGRDGVQKGYGRNCPCIPYSHRKRCGADRPLRLENRCGGRGPGPGSPDSGRSCSRSCGQGTRIRHDGRQPHGS